MRHILIGASVAFVIAACGGSSSDPAGAPNGDPYTSEPNTTVVIGPGAGGGTVVTTPVGDGCVQLPSGECIKPQTKCKQGERADVIVDSQGKVVTILCYPGQLAPTPIDAQGNVAIGKDNKGVVAIDGLDDGIDVTGDVTSGGNNVTVYGQGPATSVIGGKVAADGNNFSMRGVRVKGDVKVDGNNAALVLCFVEGDLIISGNNATVADCTVLGTIRVNGNNTILIGNEVGKGIELGDGKNAVCDSNFAWADGNGNKLLDPGETGAAIGCSTKK